MELWNTVLNRIENQISKASFETWFKATTADLTDETTVIVNAPNSFAADWLKSHYADLIIDTVKEVTGHSFDVQITYAGNKNPSPLATASVYEAKTGKYEQLEKLVQQQSRLIQKQQELINDLEKRVSLLESRRIV